MFEINKLFKKKQYISVTKLQEELETAKPNIPNGMWIKCNNCGKLIYKDDLNKNFKICDDCNYHFRLNGKERVSQIIDVDTFIEIDEKVEDLDPLNFQGYKEKILKTREKSVLDEAVITGKGKINGVDVVVAIMDSNFMMGSMGTTVGEKITSAIELATKENKPIIIFTASGGARMQEGIYSLMQMAKTSAALAKHSESGNLYISVLTDPTTGGVTASFAMLGDIILSEPNALIGFAGRRVIEQTIREELPQDFQRAEFLLKHGFIDKIVHRKDLKNILYRLLIYHNN